MSDKMFKKINRKRIEAANNLFRYIYESIGPTEITLDRSRTIELQKKLLMEQMDVPDWMQVETGRLTDKNVIEMVTATRDCCYTKPILIRQILPIMPDDVAQAVSKKLRVFEEHQHTSDGWIRDIGFNNLAL